MTKEISKNGKYTPKQSFNGKTECFSVEIQEKLLAKITK